MQKQAVLEVHIIEQYSKPKRSNSFFWTPTCFSMIIFYSLRRQYVQMPRRIPSNSHWPGLGQDYHFHSKSRRVAGGEEKIITDMNIDFNSYSTKGSALIKHAVEGKYQTNMCSSNKSREIDLGEIPNSSHTVRFFKK